MNAMQMTARRIGSDFELFANGSRIGRLADCEVCHVFTSDDAEMADAINAFIEGDMSPREMLAAVRTGYEQFQADMRAMHAFESSTEDAWLHHSERFDPEAH